ncbi:MAG: PhzF family phenazine biosynthesis protein [Rhodospirillaceae bacterium]|jgi:trans-2,3-dihydro-3-hydroxyanthranilate isomerase|nr:PhzF family phenazine biosynthesis protein [Rhodospirillaceae bacterium]
MTTVPFAFYDAFTDVAFGGSQAAVVTDAAGLDAGAMQRIAKEIGAPATGFVTASGKTGGDDWVEARFMSFVTELPMCGHGTLCLVTRMVELGVLDWRGRDAFEAALRLPKTTATVRVERRGDGRPEVMLDIKPPKFRHDDLDLDSLVGLLGIGRNDLHADLCPETACGDFIHLVLPVSGLAAMGRIAPDFGGLTRFCVENGIETVATFCTEVERPGSTIHVRDFCPAVGVAESAAAGTTNSALTSYLIRHGVVQPDGGGQIVVQAEQGLEIGRASTIRSLATMDGGDIARLQVGGVATRLIDGYLHLP